MMLSDVDILKAMDAADIIIDPFYDGKLQFSSIDLTLSNQFRTYYDANGYPYLESYNSAYKKNPTATLDPADSGSMNVATSHINANHYYDLKPGEFLLGCTHEMIGISRNIVGKLDGKSGIGRMGIFVQNAGFVDPGWRGQLTLELYNALQVSVRLYVGQPICQISFMRLETPASMGYGTKGNSYQNSMGPKPSAFRVEL